MFSFQKCLSLLFVHIILLSDLSRTLIKLYELTDVGVEGALAIMNELQCMLTFYQFTSIVCITYSGYCWLKTYSLWKLMSLFVGKKLFTIWWIKCLLSFTFNTYMYLLFYCLMCLGYSKRYHNWIYITYVSWRNWSLLSR